MQVSRENAIEAWWFSAGMILPHDDGREVKIGTIHSVKGRIVPCENGLHGSENPLDALKNAPGPIVWRTLHWGTVLVEEHQLCSTHRKYVAGGVDASDALRVFARWCALQVYDKIARDDPDGVIKKWLETGDEALRSAAWSASDSAAWSASDSAADSAACSAAWSASRSAVCSAADSAAGSAAWSASELASELAADSAACSAACSAAWSASRSAQQRRLVELLEDLFR